MMLVWIYNTIISWLPLRLNYKDSIWGDGLYKLEASDQILIVQSVHLYVIVSRK